MEKYLIKGLNAIEIGHFKSYVAADNFIASGKTATVLDKKKIIQTVEVVCNKLDREGVTKDEVKDIINELKSHPKADLLKRKDRIIEMLQTVVDGYPVEKTYTEWEKLSNDDMITDDIRIAIKGALLDQLYYIHHLKDVFSEEMMNGHDITKNKVTVYLKESDMELIA